MTGIPTPKPDDDFIPVLPGKVPARTDQAIVDQTEGIAALLASRFHGRVLSAGTYREASHPSVRLCWQTACDIQRMVTATDPEDAASAVDDTPSQPSPRGTAQVPADEQIVALADSFHLTGALNRKRAIDFARAVLALQSAPAAEHPVGSSLTEMEARKDAAYLERNQVVATLASAYPSGIARTAIDGWSEDWHGCVYIDLPTGQASWHYHDSQAHLFAHLPQYTKPWDGHTTEQKYERLAALAQENTHEQNHQ